MHFFDQCQDESSHAGGIPSYVRLPHAHDVIPEIPKTPCLLSIALPIATYLRQPVRRISSGFECSLLDRPPPAMPEVPVAEHAHVLSVEDEVWLSRKGGDMAPKGKPSLLEGSP